MEKHARFVVDELMNMASGRFDVEPADELTHPWADWRAYHRFRREAEALGFSHLADVDQVSLTPNSRIMRRPVLAIFVGPDGTEVLGHYRFVLRWSVGGIVARVLGGRGSFIDIGSRFGSATDGVELETSRSNAEPGWELPDFYRREALPGRTSLEAVLERHRERVREHASRHPDARLAVLRTMDDVIASNRASEMRKREWRRDRGWITPDELAHQSGLRGAKLDSFFQAVQRELANATDA